MTKREYAEAIAKEIEGGEVREVNKNGVIMTGITITTTNIAPVIYIDNEYENNRTVKETIKMVKETIMANANVEFDMESIKDYEAIKDKVVVRLLPAAAEADVYVDAEQYGFGGLKLVPYINVVVNGNNGSIRITEQLLDEYGIDVDTLIQQGIRNIDYSIKSMRDTIKEIMMEEGMDDDMMEFMLPPDDGLMWCVSNSSKMYGAAAIIPAIRELEAKFADGFIVIPSSVHEVLVIPKGMQTEEELTEIVQSINAGQVAPEDRLADTVYVF